MSVFLPHPTYVAPPSYSRTRIQPPPYKASPPTTTFQPIKAGPSSSSFNPIKTISRVFTNPMASTSTSSITSSATETAQPSTTTASPTLSRQLSLPPPTYSPIKSAPKPLTAAPAYSINDERRPATGARAEPSMTFEAAEWENRREREERSAFEEYEKEEREERGCCASWWATGHGSLPWAAYYVF